MHAWIEPVSREALPHAGPGSDTHVGNDRPLWRWDASRRCPGRVLAALSLLFLLSSVRTASTQSCGEAGGDYCSQSGACPSGYNSLGNTWDCHPCCRSAPQGPSCGAIGGDWCSQSGGCPSGYDSLGTTYDCHPCCKQRAQGQMSFSVNTGASISQDLSYLYASSTVIDYSWGCSHSSYSTRVTIYSPSGRVASSQSSGLQASVSLATAGEFGTYSIVTTGTYYCSCVRTTAGFGASRYLDFYQPYDVVPIYPDTFISLGIGKYWKQRNRQVYSYIGPWKYSAPLLAYFGSAGTNTCSLQTPRPTSTSTNNQGRFSQTYTADIPACRPPYNKTDCLSAFSESIVVAGVELAPFEVIYGCEDVALTK